MTSITGKTPTVTVLIPVHNRERYIATAIDSILLQSFQDFEIIVIDDGSNDRTPDIISRYSDSRVRLLRNEYNLGIPKARNLGLDEARGLYIANLDSDDYALPQRLERQAAFLDAHPDYAEVGSWGCWMDEYGQPIRGIKYQPTHWDELRFTLLFNSGINNRSSMMRSAPAKALRYDEAFTTSQDFEMRIRMIQHYKIANLPEVLVVARKHPSQISTATHDAGMLRKREIHRKALDLAGLTYTESDLDRHWRLAHAKRLGLIPNRDFLQWAEAWLARLANTMEVTPVTRRRVCARLWWNLAQRAASENPALAPNLMCSPLAVGAVTLFREYLATAWAKRSRYVMAQRELA